ncbi:MAG: DMT family transporter [Rikenellaceae bacterium]
MTRWEQLTQVTRWEQLTQLTQASGATVYYFIAFPPHGALIAAASPMNRIKPHIALFLCNAIWAINYPFYHIVMSKGISAAAMLELSLLVAALFSFVPLLWGRAERVERGDIKYLVAAAVLSGLLRKGLVVFGLSLTSPIDASIIGSLLPVMALLISVVMGVDRFTLPRVAGVALGMAGALAVILSGGAAGGGALSGNLLMLVYTVAAGFYMVWLQPIFRKYRPVTLLRWVYSISALLFLPFGYADLVQNPFAGMSPHILYMAAFVVVVPTFLPNLLLNFALSRVTPTISSIYSYLQPVLAISVSVWLGVDKLHWSTLLFGVVIVAGVALVIGSYTTARRRDPGIDRAPWRG